MKPNIIECEQYSPEWYEHRRGKVTASQLGAVMAKGRSKNDVSATRLEYLGRIVSERLTGESREDTYTSRAMEWGKLHEDKARSLYEIRRGVELEQVGLVMHPRIENACASPDRRVRGTNNLVEIKCPDTHTHIGRLLSKEPLADIETNYLRQMQFQMACMGSEWVDFVSYDPRMPPECQMLITRVHRDPVMIAEIEAAIETFLADVDVTVEQLVNTYMVAA